jgi:hypothetical protein
MNYFLLFIIVALCGGGYYEYTLQEKSNAYYHQQINDLEAKIDKLESDGAKAGKEKAELSGKLADAQKKIADLTSQITVAAATQGAEDAGKATATVQASRPNQAAMVSFNNLGTVIRLDGKTFQNCQLLRVETDGITFNHSDGIAKILFPLLPPDLQKRFGFNPGNGTELTDAQVAALEAQRKAVPKTPGN